MQKNINVKNVKEYEEKVNIYIKNYKVTSNRNINKEINKQDKEKIYQNNKYIEKCIKTYENIYTNMKIYKYIDMHVEIYLCENIKEYKKQKVQDDVQSVKNVYRKICFTVFFYVLLCILYLEPYGLHYFLNRLIILKKNFLLILF